RPFSGALRLLAPLAAPSAHPAHSVRGLRGDPLLLRLLAYVGFRLPLRDAALRTIHALRCPCRLGAAAEAPCANPLAVLGPGPDAGRGVLRDVPGYGGV